MSCRKSWAVKTEKGLRNDLTFLSLRGGVMQHHKSLLAEPHQVAPWSYLAATDSIGTVSDSVPVHPEDKHPSFDDFKQKSKRKPHSEQPPDGSDDKHPDSDHQIDEYA